VADKITAFDALRIGPNDACTQPVSISFKLLFGNQRSDLRFRVEPIADPQSLAECRNAIGELIIDFHSRSRAVRVSCGLLGLRW
jgi:hypothetical protein